MANTVSDAARAAFLGGDLDWLVDNIKVVLLDATYTYSSAHDNLNDIGGGAIVATSGNLASKTATAGVADAADVTFTALTGDPITQMWVYKDTGVSSTSTLICFYDNDSNSAPIAVTPDGTNVIVSWSNSSTKMFRI